MSEDILVGLRQALPGLRPSERRLAESVLADPAEAAALTISALAERHRTSTATVTRLCRSLGFSGYPPFRLALARAGASEAGRRVAFGVSGGDIDPADSTREVVRKLAYEEARAIEETATRLDLDQLERVVGAITASSVIDAHGSGSSGLAAQDLQQKMRRIGYQVNAWADAHLAITSAAVLPADAVAIAFSHSGETEEAVSTLRTASARGAFTVAVTNFPDSPLASLADATLGTVARETRFRYGAMSSRMAQLIVVDAIFLGVAQADPERVTDALGATFDAVASRRLGSR